MPQPDTKLQAKKLERTAESKRRAAEIRPTYRIARVTNLTLVILALVYGFLSGFHTILDLDLGFHLATGRYVVQHHSIPSTDVLSYTASGKEWLYPPFAGVLLYGIISVLGYAGLSWLCALVLLALIAILLYGALPSQRGFAAALTIMAVPVLATRTSPRPDLFTHLFFAIFLVVLYRFQRTSQVIREKGADQASSREHLWLWALPPIMVLWVNFHPGFTAGLSIVAAYLLAELLEFFFPKNRAAAQQRLKEAWPTLVTVCLVTLLNPFGPRVFKASLVIAGLQGTNLPSSGVSEWEGVPISFSSLSQALNWRDPQSSFWWLAIVALVAIALAFWRRQLWPALLMTGALYVAIQHNRLKGLFAIVVVVVGNAIIAEALSGGKQRDAAVSRLWGIKSHLSVAAAVGLVLITCIRIADLVSSRAYVVAGSTTQFGPGEASWFPERAADFIKREHLPGNIFQKYELGGFTAWRLGPAYGDFIDGRFDHMAPAVMEEETDLLISPVDSLAWQTEADRRNINFLMFSLARIYGIGSPDLESLCQSQQWRPIYIDDVSIVLVRNRPENSPLIRRFGIDCQNLEFVRPHASRLELSNFYGNVGVILLSLGRFQKAEAALQNGATLSPDDPTIHLALARLYDAKGEAEDSEREYKAALTLRQNDESILYALGRFYVLHKRFAEARRIVSTAAEFTSMPANDYSLLGIIDADIGQPQQALEDLDKAEDVGSRYWHGRENENPVLFAQIAAGRASAYAQLGRWQQAIASQQEATRRTPENANRWKILGDLYERNGQSELAERAYQRANALSK